MLPISDYEVYIFDCDGVILDSNELKINAMANSLQRANISQKKVTQCVTYFKNNFGKSRFYHVNYFVEQILMLKGDFKKEIYTKILESYSSQCNALYLGATLTPGILDLLESLNGDVYIASGSAEDELRSVFEQRDLSKYFKGIYGSPEKKSNIVNLILKEYQKPKAVIFGDAFSDYEASVTNNIDFVGYLPFSNVADGMVPLSVDNNLKTINRWSEL